MWYRAWTVGNGGIESEEGFFEFDESYGEDDIEWYLEAELGPFCSGTRSVNWEPVDVLPDKVIEEKISSAKSSIAYNEDLITRLEKMKKEKV